MNAQEEVPGRLYFVFCHVSLPVSPEQRASLSFSLLQHTIPLETAPLLLQQREELAERAQYLLTLQVGFFWFEARHALCDMLQLARGRTVKLTNCLSVH